jgi:hypothetical protein
MLRLEGNTLAHKDSIKAAGYMWGDVYTGNAINALIGYKPSKAWHKIIGATKLAGNPQENWQKIHEEEKAKLAGILQEEKLEVGALEFQFLMDYIKNKEASKQKEAQKKAEIGPSPMRQHLSDEDYKSWNGKIYGTERYGYSIYALGQKIEIGKELVAAQAEWRAHRDAINEKYAAQAKEAN